MNDEQKYVVVMITAKNKQEGQKIAQGLLKAKLAACINILDGVESHFTWKGKIEKAQEVLLMVKTKQKLFEKVVTKVKLLHSYDVPEIIALPLVGGSWNYLQWINETVQ